MATTKTIQATVKNRTDTAANWTQKNPVLAEGEIIVVQTSAGETRLKIGDGVKTFTQLPYTDEQIYNSVVTSVNGQTGDITTNSVEYTPQTLTDAQKKQARDNVEAASEFVITATPDSSGERVTLDKTAAQIQEAVSAGKTPVVRLEAAGVSSYLRFLNAAGTTFVFGGVFSGRDGGLLNTLIVDEGGTHVTSQNLLSTDQNGRLDQQTMAYPPTEDMHIATKEYVDDGLAGKAGTDVATESANGLMSKEDKTKLDGIAAGATKITIDSAMSGSSNNPVANHVVKQYVDDKVAAAGSNITVDSTLSDTSTNPVQNKAVKAALDGKLPTSGGTLTGNLTGKYITGTWLQSTAASDLGRTPGKIAVLDDSGWVYYRTPSELFADLGITNAIKSYVDAAIVAAINSAY